MATMSGGVVERENTIEKNKQLVSELMERNEFAELSQDELTGLFAKLNADNAKDLTRDMNSYVHDWRNQKVTGRRYGPIPGIPPGSWWGIRMDCSRDRMHDPFSASVQPGPVGAISVCTSYSNEDVDLGDVLTFTGETYSQEQKYIVGEMVGDNEQNLDNRSLILNLENRVPIRLIRSYNLRNEFSPKTGYRYDGLYAVVDYWIGISLGSGARCHKFAFKRLSDQEPPSWRSQTSRDRMAQPILGRYSTILNLIERKNAASNHSAKANNNDAVISRCILTKRFQKRDGAKIKLVEDGNVDTPKVRHLRKRKQNTVDETSLQTKERDNLSTQEVVSTMLGYQSRKMTVNDKQNVNVSTIVTRRVSKKLQNNRVDVKLPYERTDKPLRNVCYGNEPHYQNDEGENDSLKSPGSRLQNTNISIRTDLYDSSHNIKDHVKKWGSAIAHGGGVFKPRVLGAPRRQLHFAGVDSSPRNSKTVTSVKMERMKSLDNSKKSNCGSNKVEKDKPSPVGNQSPESGTRTMTDILSRNSSSHSDEHSYASPSIRSQLCDNGFEENCRNSVNEATNENRNMLKSCQHVRCEEKISEQRERIFETGLRKNSNNLQSIESSAEESPSLSESPPFKGFECTGPSGFEGLWAKSSLLANSLTMEKMLDIIAVDKTSPMAKMLISSVIGFPATESVRIFQELNSSDRNLEPVSQPNKEPEISTQGITSQNNDRSRSSGREKWLSSIRTRSHVDLDKKVTLKPAEQDETNGSSSRESGFRSTGNAVPNTNSRESGELRCLDDNGEESIGEIAYAEEETQLSQELIDSDYKHTRCSSASYKLDSNSSTTNVQSCSSKNARKTSDGDVKMRRTSNESNRNPPIVKQYSNKKRIKAGGAQHEVSSRNSVPECFVEGEKAGRDEGGNPLRVCRDSKCDKSVDEESVDTVDCPSENPIRSEVDENARAEDEKNMSSLPGECNSHHRTTTQSPTSAETSKLNNNVCDKLSVNDNTCNSGAEVPSVRETYPKSSGSGSASKKKSSSEQMRLVKRSRVRTKRRIEIANLVIDMNMSPRCQISKSRTSQRGGNYLRRRGCTTILDQSRKRRNVDPVKHPTSPLKRVKKNVQLQSSPVKIASAGSPKKSLPLQRRSDDRGNSSKDGDSGIKISKSNTSSKRMRRAEKKVTKKKPIKLKERNINSAEKPAEIPKIIRKQDTMVMRAKEADQKTAVQHSRRDSSARTRSGRSLRGVAIGRLGLRRALLPSSETFVRKEMEKKKETESIENLGKQHLSRREFNSLANLICKYCKLPLNARKPKMVSVMTQCSLISDPPQRSADSISAVSVRTNNESDLLATNVRYSTTSENGSECICSSRKSDQEEIKNEMINVTETKSEAFDLDVVSHDFGNDESEENGRPVFERALDRLKSDRRDDPLYSRSNIQSPDKSKRLTLRGRSDSDSNRGFIRYVASRRRVSAFVPVRSVGRNFRIAQLKSIGFKPIKPGIFPPDVRDEESEFESLRTSDSPKIVYSSGVVKRGVNEEYDKYTSEENNVVQYMDSELCYEDIENEDNAVGSSVYCNEEEFKDVFMQKLEFLKLGFAPEEEGDENSIDEFETQEEELEEDEEEELELELERNENDVEQEELMEEEEDEEEEEEEEAEEEEETEEERGEGEVEVEREDEEESMEVEVEEFKMEEYETEWQAQRDVKSSSCEGTEQTVVDSDSDVPWHGWRKIISNKETYFVGW